MIANLALAGLMVGLSVIIHFGGLFLLIWVLRARGHNFQAHRSTIGQAAAIVVVVLGRDEAFERVVLETGDRHPAAWTVYERAGFTRCGPVLDYPDSKWSVFYEKRLVA